MQINPRSFKPAREQVVLEFFHRRWKGKDGGGDAAFDLKIVEGDVELAVKEIGEWHA